MLGWCGFVGGGEVVRSQEVEGWGWECRCSTLTHRSRKDV